MGLFSNIYDNADGFPYCLGGVCPVKLRKTETYEKKICLYFFKLSWLNGSYRYCALKIIKYSYHGNHMHVIGG